MRFCKSGSFCCFTSFSHFLYPSEAWWSDDLRLLTCVLQSVKEAYAPYWLKPSPGRGPRCVICSSSSMLVHVSWSQWLLWPTVIPASFGTNDPCIVLLFAIVSYGCFETFMLCLFIYCSCLSVCGWLFTILLVIFLRVLNGLSTVCFTSWLTWYLVWCHTVVLMNEVVWSDQ